MLNKKERMEKLTNAGIDTGKYFTLNVNESIPAGAKIHVIIDDNGQPVIKAEKANDDVVFNQIITDGYVRNTKLHRRFVMAQMFAMLNYVSHDGQYNGYNDCLKKMYGYEYTLQMMTEEVRVLSKLEVRDKESFVERSHFFTKEVVVAVLEDYVEKLKEYVVALPDRNCKGITYKRVKGVNIFNADLDKKLYAITRTYIFRIKYAKNYAEIYMALEGFMRNHVKLPYDTAKSKAWIDAYKGEGAFYTLKNLVMFHNCFIEIGEDFGYTYKVNGMGAMKVLNDKLDEYKGEGWRMFALMKKVIADNNFDFDAHMKEIYNK